MYTQVYTRTSSPPTSSAVYDCDDMRLTRRKIYMCFGWGAFGAGTAFLLVSIGFALYESWFLAQSLRAPGTVIANVQHEVPADAANGTPAQTDFCPQFRYTSADGATHIATASTCSSPPSFAVGEQVGVNYSKSDYADGQIDSFGDKWGFPLAFGLVGLVAIPIGIALLKHLRSQGHSLDPISAWE